MPKPKLSIYNPKINEYLYDRLQMLSHEQKKNLSSSELKLITPDRNLRKFVTWATLEKKMAIMTKVGIQWSLSIYADSDNYKDLLSKVYKQYTLKNLKLDNIEEMRDKGIFVMGNKEIALSLAMLAQNCHSDFYYLNKDFIKVHNSIANANSSKQSNPLNTEYIKSEDAFKMVTKVIFEAKMAENLIQSEGLEVCDAMMLLYLHTKAKTYVTIDAMQRAVAGQYTERTIGMRATLLFHANYIDKLPSESRIPSYTITAKGIMFIGRVLHRVVNNAVNT